MDRVALSASILSLVSVPVAVGQNFSGSPAAAQGHARLDHAVVAHDDEDERRARGGLRRCLAGHEGLEQRQAEHQPAGAPEDHPSIHRGTGSSLVFHGAALREGD